MHDPAAWGARPAQQDKVQSVPLALVARGTAVLASPANTNTATKSLAQFEKRDQMTELRIIVGVMILSLFNMRRQLAGLSSLGARTCSSAMSAKRENN
jgi:hypothetical protein